MVPKESSIRCLSSNSEDLSDTVGGDPAALSEEERPKVCPLVAASFPDPSVKCA